MGIIKCLLIISLIASIWSIITIEIGIQSENVSVWELAIAFIIVVAIVVYTVTSLSAMLEMGKYVRGWE